MVDLRTMKIEMSQDTRRQVDHLTKAVEGLTKAISEHKDGDVTFYADNSPYLIRGDEDGFLEPVLHAKIDETGAVINHDGENYYKSCAVIVTGEIDNGTSTCVLPAGHDGELHVDWDGKTKEV